VSTPHRKTCSFFASKRLHLQDVSVDLRYENYTMIWAGMLIL
jgi:hypothetical protein